MFHENPNEFIVCTCLPIDDVHTYSPFEPHRMENKHLRRNKKKKNGTKRSKNKTQIDENYLRVLYTLASVYKNRSAMICHATIKSAFKVNV